MPSMFAKLPRSGSARSGRGAQRRFQSAGWAVAAAFSGVTGLAVLDAWGVPPGTGPVRRILIDRELNESVAQVVSIDESGVWVRLDREPASTPPRLRRASELVAMMSADPQRQVRRVDSDDRPRVTVVLTDGQRLVGRLARESQGAVPATETTKDAPLAVESAVGMVRVPLDAVSCVEVNQAVGEATETRKDTVKLSNGDVMEGFVESIGPLVAVQPDGAPRATVPLDHVSVIRLANPPAPVRGARAWLTDGSVVSVAELSQSVDSLPVARVPLLGRDSSSPLPNLDSVVFDSARLVSLSRIAPESFSPSADRRWTRAPRAMPGPAPLDAPDLELPGPMTVEWELPQGAVRLAGTFELARFTEAWGDCTVTIELGSGGGFARAWSQRLDGPSSGASFSLNLGNPAQGRHLRVTLESGPDGPIQDRVILRRPLLLLAQARE